MAKSKLSHHLIDGDLFFGCALAPKASQISQNVQQLMQAQSFERAFLLRVYQ